MARQAVRQTAAGVVKRWQARVNGRTRIAWAPSRSAAAEALGVPRSRVEPAPPDWRNRSRGGRVRTVQLALRISPAEKAAILTAAKAAGMTLVDWIVSRCATDGGRGSHKNQVSTRG